jgi:hypothetical protein
VKLILIEEKKMKNETTNMIIENVKINKIVFVETYIHEE